MRRALSLRIALRHFVAAGLFTIAHVAHGEERAVHRSRDVLQSITCGSLDPGEQLQSEQLWHCLRGRWIRRAACRHTKIAISARF
jgi:hypothetical protein